jgi:hypothetical protein
MTFSGPWPRLAACVLVREALVQYLDNAGPALPTTSPERDPGILRPTALGLPPRCAHRPAGPGPTQGAGSVVMSQWRVARDGELTSARVMLDTLPSVI